MGNKKTKMIVNVGIFAGIAFVLQFIGSMIGLKVGGFLEIEISDVPALIVALLYGPLAGVMVEFIKNLLHCFITSTGFVGEFANFAVNGILCFIAGIIYKHKRTFKGAMVALFAAVIVMALAGAAVNLFVMLPLYMPDADFDTKFNLVTKLIIPFNIARGIGVSLITVFTYKHISRIIRK